MHQDLHEKSQLAERYKLLPYLGFVLHVEHAQANFLRKNGSRVGRACVSTLYASLGQGNGTNVSYKKSHAPKSSCLVYFPSAHPPTPILRVFMSLTGAVSCLGTGEPGMWNWVLSELRSSAWC